MAGRMRLGEQRRAAILRESISINEGASSRPWRSGNYAGMARTRLAPGGGSAPDGARRMNHSPLKQFEPIELRAWA